MSNICMILGKSGTGKSTSIRTLDPKETVIFNVLKKRLPFKGSNSLYNEENKNMFFIDSYDRIITMLNAINEKATHVKNIIIDDMIYIMRKAYFKSAKVKGYDKFVDMSAQFQSIIATAENLRNDLNIFMVFHSEDVVSDNSIVTYKPSTIGKMIDSSYNPMEVVPLVLYSDVLYDDDKKPIYGFHTHRCISNGVEIPSKSPDGMFEEAFIPNDLNLVVKMMTEYYN